MAGHKKWRDLIAPIKADPVRRARMEEIGRAMDDIDKIVALHDLRSQRGATQCDLAGALGTSQANVSQIEGRDDIYLSTLSHYVEALGGHLEIAAVFPDQTIYLMGHPAPAHAQPPA
jgi:hypothetical protein